MMTIREWSQGVYFLSVVIQKSCEMHSNESHVPWVWDSVLGKEGIYIPTMTPKGLGLVSNIIGNNDWVKQRHPATYWYLLVLSNLPKVGVNVKTSACIE